jgi:hypothetical protein
MLALNLDPPNLSFPRMIGVSHLHAWQDWYLYRKRLRHQKAFPLSCAHRIKDTQ